MTEKISGKKLTVAVLASLAVLGWQLPVSPSANAAPSVPDQTVDVMAQDDTGEGDVAPLAAITGTCRALKSSAFVYRSASTSEPIRSVPSNTVVRLAADAGTNGFIAVNLPIVGFVQANNLTPAVPCPGGPTPTPPADRCRRVLRPMEGLVIRSQPSTTATLVGGVAQNQTVTLTTSPATSKADSLGRIWIEVAAPQKGWVSNGFPNSPSNLVFCR